MLNFFLTAMALLIFQTIFYLFIKEFKIDKINILFGIIIPLLCYNMYNVVALLIMSAMVTLSIVDIKYYEISKHSYWFLLLPSLYFSIMNPWNFLSPILIYIIFYIIYKIIGLSGIGGADIKILLILGLTVEFHNSLMLILLSLIADMLLYAIKWTFYKIIKKEEKVRIPMIPAILIAWGLMTCFLLN